MSKSILEEINQTGETLTRTIDACVLRRNYYALETSSIKESFDSDVFNFYEDSKYDNVEKPNARTRRIDRFTIDYSFDEDFSVSNSNNNKSSLDHSSDLDSFDSVISNFKSFEENPINTSSSTATNSSSGVAKPQQNNKNSTNDDSIKSDRLAVPQYFRQSRASIAEYDEEIRQVRNKVRQINDLDYNVNSLIFKAVAVHTDILVLDATVNRLLAETKELIQELDDVKFLDDLIDILNQDIGPVIHTEWKYSKYKCDGPIEQGVMVLS